jgi:hypothetical protein
MKIITFQHEKVLETIELDGVYFCDYIGRYHKATPQSYKFLKDNFIIQKPKAKIHNPIFGWSRVLRDEDIIDENNPKTISRMLDMTSFGDGYKMVVLDIPEDHVMETDFYLFVDLRCEEEFGDVIFTGGADCKESILYPRTNNSIEIQAIFGEIRKEWIIRILPYPVDDVINT